MRKLYDEFFHIPKHGKIREKVMLVRVAMTVAVVIACLAAMGFTAYAYFSYNVTSGSNIIKAANFEADVEITITDPENNPVPVTKNGKVQSATLNASEHPYTVLLTKGASTANTGFCVVTIGNAKYYTDQIGVDAAKHLDDARVEFKLKVSSDTTIEILSHWGTSSYYGYQDADRTELFIANGEDLTTVTPSGDADKPEDTTEPSGGTTTTTPSETTTATKPSNTTVGSTTTTAESTTTTSTTAETTTEDTTPTTTEVTGTTAAEENE